jgi:5-(carboxyamino)imidazole ribonucleotide synthase
MKVGILGGGQLGLMLAQAARKLEIEPIVLDPKTGAVAGRVARHLEAAWDDPSALDELAACDVVTYEFENVPTATVDRLAGRVPVHPSPISLAISGDRVREKEFFRDLGIETAPFEPVSSRADLDRGLATLGLPAILKTRRFGYDGKGQAVLRSPADVDQAWDELAGHELVLEGFVPFDREVSVVVVRGRDGEIRTWPATENIHIDGILHLSRAPAPDVPPALFASAAKGLEAIMAKLDYVGVLVVEFFELDGRWIANEMACRVHNSTHWTIEGAATSQFENHIRAVVGMPLGKTEVSRHSAMLNLVGQLPTLDELEADPDIHVHVYGKREGSGRKIGHITVVGDTFEACEAKIRQVLDVVGDRSVDR